LAFSTGVIVKDTSGRQGTVIYDNPAITDDTHPSCYVIFPGNTYKQFKRSSLTQVAVGWVPGTGPGQ
jgi:hypothetical protein